MAVGVVEPLEVVAVGRSIVRPAACLIADDDAPSHILARQALDGRGFVVVGEVGDATAEVDAVPDTTVVMFTGSQSDTDLFDALRAGASGYLFKNTDPARLPLALHGVFRGEAALPRTLAAPADRGVPAAGAAQAAAAAQRTGRRPDTEGLCQAFTADKGSEQGKKLDAAAFEALAQAAGGADKITAFCQGMQPGKAKPEKPQQQEPPDDQGQGQGGPPQRRGL
jgi:CheY-like chemotaxis protein